MTRFYRFGLQLLVVFFAVLPIALWAWAQMSVTLLCTLDEASSACNDPDAGLAGYSFLQLAVLPWALAWLCHYFGSRMALKRRRSLR